MILRLVEPTPLSIACESGSRPLRVRQRLRCPRSRRGIHPGGCGSYRRGWRRVTCEFVTDGSCLLVRSGRGGLTGGRDEPLRIDDPGSGPETDGRGSLAGILQGRASRCRHHGRFWRRMESRGAARGWRSIGRPARRVVSDGEPTRSSPRAAAGGTFPRAADCGSNARYVDMSVYTYAGRHRRVRRNLMALVRCARTAAWP